MSKKAGAEKESIIKGFKGFDKGLKCRGFQFEVGKTFEHEGEVSICSSGFHLCENPLDVLRYYGPATSEYCEVEGSGKTQGHKDDSKHCVSKLTVGIKTSLKAMISIGVKMIVEKAKPATSGNYSPSATSGNSSPSATSGDSSPSATSGDYSPSATSGDSSPSATSGDSSHSATSGDSSHSATSGNYSHSATSGNYSHSATSGDYSPSATSGDSSPSATSGENSIACAIGKRSSAKSAKGNWIVLSEHDCEGNVVLVKTAIVDGKKIKSDTFYKLQGGKFVEA